MRFRLGLVMGLLAGIAIGVRLGRERYDRLVARLEGIVRSERTQKAAALGERSTRKARAAAGRGMVDLADSIRDRAAN
jgi:hypothetical protein